MEQPGVLIAERLEATVDELATELAALPEESFTRRAALGGWTAAEVVGHLTEMMPYWARVAAEVGKQPRRPLGRRMAAPARLGAVPTANVVPRAEPLAPRRPAVKEAAPAIKANEGAFWSGVGVHPTFGELPGGGFIPSRPVEHADGPVGQA